MKWFSAFCIVGVATATPSVKDLQRAHRATPRDHLRGKGPAAIREKLNAALKQGSLKMPQGTPCQEFTLSELGELQKTFFPLRSPELLTKDLRAPRHLSMSALLEELREETKYLERHPEVEEALRDGKCAELAMQWVHHLSEDARGAFTEARLPLLANKGTAEHGPTLINGGHHHIAKKLAAQVTCQTGHDAKAQTRGTWGGWPDWPYEVEYNATGYGPYPFWTAGGPPLAAQSNASTTGAPIHTYWSAVLNAEKLEHNGQCSLVDVGGGFSSDGPCTHLMLGTEYAYLYDNAQTHCCISSEPTYACHMTTMERDFVSKLFEYKGDIENYKSESGYFTGKVKHYSTALAPSGNIFFWYVTDEDGKPIEQGEGGCDFTGSHSCSTGPKYLYHQYNPATFKETTLDPSVFAVPEVCKTTTSKCEVTPTFFCGDSKRILV